jgi:SulP family sulfate permease
LTIRPTLPLPNSLTLTHWRADFRGGLQAAAVALPMGLAFGVVSGLGPVAGIYSAVWTGIFAALFGGTATQISGPTGPIAIVMASVLVTFAEQPAAAFAIILLAGILQIAFGMLRLGRYINLVPYPVISGFSTGVGCIIIVMQLNPMLGRSSVTDTLTAVEVLPESIAHMSMTAFLVAFGCFAACQWLPLAIRRIVPAHLLVLVVASALVAAFGLGLPRLATPDSLLPTLTLPPVTELPWSDMWVSALVLALISSLDSLVTSVSADNATQRFHDSDKELVGQGLGNVAAGLFGALPGAGSTFRTMANIRAGGRTPLSGVFHSLLLLGLLLTAGALIGFVPASVLAGILIYIGLGIIDWSYIRRFPMAPRGGVAIMVIVWLISVFGNIVTAVALGIVMASLGFVKRMADLQIEAMQLSVDGLKDSGLDREEAAALDDCGGKTLFIRLGGPLTFGAANGITKRLANIAAYRSVILEFMDVPHIDESAVVALENVIRRATNNDQIVILVGLRSAVIRTFASFGLLPLIKRCARFRRRLDALRYAARVNDANV